MANDLLAISTTDNFAAAAAETTSSSIVGERLRSSKGQFLIGCGDGERLPDSIERASVPGAVAIVKLATGYKKTRQYGQIAAPKFIIAGWVGEAGADGGLPTVNARHAENDLNDEIPF